ncbi:hypothetical protein DCCM_3212 [Desulfocucumis palustris]|uniref:Flp pilus assembly protein TadG n=1 Tax=Desulfocucumis palustris TaxID=1898651 RepID=A0A2L2XD73_9FIRM|nr:TadE/TadG family type IV pilus assembly protein [Desulfocucumis palustris]GBF34100.1 hypothetical protein DCCM_3212 [Desulfocucumis palustris]
MLKDRRGDIMVMVVFIIPITLFLLNFMLTYGLAEYSKSTLITASREAARTYAVSHDRELARTTAENIITQTLNSDREYFNPGSDIVLFDEGKYAAATVNYRVPVAVPAMFRLIGVNTIIGNHMQVSSTARFVKEAVPSW